MKRLHILLLVASLPLGATIFGMDLKRDRAVVGTGPQQVLDHLSQEFGIHPNLVENNDEVDQACLLNSLSAAHNAKARLTAMRAAQEQADAALAQPQAQNGHENIVVNVEADQLRQQTFNSALKRGGFALLPAIAAGASLWFGAKRNDKKLTRTGLVLAAAGAWPAWKAVQQVGQLGEESQKALLAESRASRARKAQLLQNALAAVEARIALLQAQHAPQAVDVQVHVAGIAGDPVQLPVRIVAAAGDPVQVAVQGVAAPGAVAIEVPIQPVVQQAIAPAAVPQPPAE